MPTPIDNCIDCPFYIEEKSSRHVTLVAKCLHLRNFGPKNRRWLSCVWLHSGTKQCLYIFSIVRQCKYPSLSRKIFEIQKFCYHGITWRHTSPLYSQLSLLQCCVRYRSRREILRKFYRWMAFSDTHQLIWRFYFVTGKLHSGILTKRKEKKTLTEIWKNTLRWML